MVRKPIKPWSARPAEGTTWRALGLLSVGPLLAGSLLAISACTTPEKGATASPPDDTVAGTVHVCSSCHGPGGKNDNSTFPILAGQQQEYIQTQLRAFRDKSRADPHAHTYMWGMAARLSDPTIDGLAAYYSGQPPVSGSPGNPALVAAGRKIFEEGIPATDVPACQACHGDKAQGNGPIPRLAGQHLAYLERQLDAFASNARANEIMHENSKNLTPQQISEVANYLAAQ
jgi:cytochrome c553